MIISRKTIANDEKYLRQISKKVNFADKDLKQELLVIEQYAKETQCFALAAVQIGIPKRIIYLKNTKLEFIDDENKDENKIIINPKIISRKGMAKYWEACLSCLDNMGLVTRPYEIELEYYDINAKRIREKFIGFESTVISHELDHLDGILHIDIAEKIINMSKEERKQFRIEHPYEVISKDCKYRIK